MCYDILYFYLVVYNVIIQSNIYNILKMKVCLSLVQTKINKILMIITKTCVGYFSTYSFCKSAKKNNNNITADFIYHPDIIT